LGFLPVDTPRRQNTLPSLTVENRRFTIPPFEVAGEEVNGLTEIKLKKGEPIERALRRLKKKLDREGTLRTVRSHRHYEKPSEKRRRKEKVAAFTAMLKARYADM
jgi:small subunit ribosomal protein S21